ncbi:MAG: Rrf2 family transcriptional regulator [Coriobacteriaceae bacterium]|nr:Rrf2 family transcriptional regulator [Coriobacteriaceae bacterium]
MDISRKTDYALRMLSMLASNENPLLSVRAAAESGDVPYSFARSIQHSLAQAGIIESLRGVHGGMRLKVDAKTITLREVVEAVQGPIVTNSCAAADGVCPRAGNCCYHPIWVGTQELLRNYLDSVTLYDVVHGVKFPSVDSKFADPSRFVEYVGCNSTSSCHASVREDAVSA